MAGRGDAEFGWQQSQPPVHAPIFESSHSVHVRQNHASEASAQRKWLQDAEARKKRLQQEAKKRREEGDSSRMSRRATRSGNAHMHGKHAKTWHNADALGEHHGDDPGSEHEAGEDRTHHTTIVEEPFVPWTPYVPPEAAEGTDLHSPRSKSSKSGDAVIEKEIGVKRLWAVAHKKAQVRMNEFRYQKALSDATGNVHKFLLYSKSQASVKKLEHLVNHHDFFTSSTRYRGLVRELKNPAKALQAFEDSVDYESQCYFTQLSDALVPLAQNAKKRQAETQQLRAEGQENEANDLEYKVLQAQHKQVHVEAKALMDGSVLRLRSGVSNAMKEFAEVSQEIIRLRRDYSHRLAYYHKYWEEMGELERRQHYIQGIIQEVEDRRAEIEKRERAKIETLEDALKQSEKKADLLERQCEEERLRSRSVFSWIVKRIEESQMANVEEMLEARFRRQQRETAYQRRAVVFRKSCLEREIRHKKISLAQEQKRHKRDNLVAKVLDLRLHSLEASGLMLEIKMRKRDMTHDGCVWESEVVKNGLFQLLLSEIDAQLQWFADRNQPWEFCRNTLRLTSQPPLTSPLSLLRCSRELVERWQAQARLLEEMNAKSWERKVTESLPPLTPSRGRTSRSNSVGASCDDDQNAPLGFLSQAGLVDEEEILNKPGAYSATLDLGESVDELLQQWKHEDDKDAPATVGKERKGTGKNVTDVIFAAVAKRGFSSQKSKKTLKEKQALQHTELEVEEKQVSGRPSCLDELANLPGTIKIVDWVGDQWVRLHPTLRRLALGNVEEVTEKMEEVLADLQEARDIAETSIHWITEGSRGPGVFSDMLLKDLGWLMRLADRIAERAGTLRAIVEMLTAVSLEIERGRYLRALNGSMHLLRAGKPLVNEGVLQQAEIWHLRVMKALHAEACFHGACNSALRWYCGKFYGEGSADVNEITRGLNVLSRLLTGPQIEAVMNKMMSSELYAEIRLALINGLRREEPQAYESALLAMSVLHASTAEESIGTSFPPSDLPEGMVDPDDDNLPEDAEFNRPSVPLVMLGSDQMKFRKSDTADKLGGEPGQERSSSADSGGRLSVTADELLETWSSELAGVDKISDEDDLMGTGTTAVPNSTSDSLSFSSPLTMKRFSQRLLHGRGGQDGSHGDPNKEAEHGSGELLDDSQDPLSLSPSEGTLDGFPPEDPSQATGDRRAAGEIDAGGRNRRDSRQSSEGQWPGDIDGEIDDSGRRGATQLSSMAQKIVSRMQVEEVDEDAGMAGPLQGGAQSQAKQEQGTTSSDGRRQSDSAPEPTSREGSPERLSASSPSLEDEGAEGGYRAFKPRPRELARSVIDNLFMHAPRETPDSVRASRLMDDMIKLSDGLSSSASETENVAQSNDDDPASARAATDQGHETQAAQAGDEQLTDAPRSKKLNRMRSRKSISGEAGVRVDFNTGEADEHHHQHHQQHEEDLGLAICGRKSQGAEDSEKKSGSLFKRRSSVHRPGLQRQGTMDAHAHERPDRHWVHSTTKTHLVGMHGEGADHWEHSKPDGGHSGAEQHSAPDHTSKPKLSFTLAGHHIDDSDGNGGHADTPAAKARELQSLKRSGTLKNSLQANRSVMNTPNDSAVSSGDSALDDADKASVIPNRKTKVLEALSEHHWEKTQTDGNTDFFEHSSPSRTSMHSRASRGIRMDTSRDPHFRTSDMFVGTKPGTVLDHPPPSRMGSHRASILHHRGPQGQADDRVRLGTIKGHHVADVNDYHNQTLGHYLSKSGGDDDVCSFADLAARKSRFNPENTIKRVSGIHDDLVSSFLDHMFDEYERTEAKMDTSRKTESHNDINGQIGHWLAKIEPEVALSTLAEHKAFHGQDKEHHQHAGSVASTATPESLTETGEHARDPIAEGRGAGVSKVLSPRFPLITPGNSLPGSARVSENSRSPKKQRAGVASKANTDDQKPEPKFQPSASDEHDLETWMRQHNERIPWLKSMREEWQGVFQRDAELTARIAHTDIRLDPSKLVQIPEVAAMSTATKKEASVVFSSGRVCGTPSALAKPANMHIGHGQGAPGVLLKTSPTLKTDKDLRPLPVQPWTTIDGTSGESPGTNNVARMLRDLRDVPGPAGSRSNSTRTNSARTTPASSRSPPKSLAKRRRRELHDSM